MDTVTAAPEPIVMTNLEAQTRCKAAFEENAAFWQTKGNAERALFWTAMANSCQIQIDGILTTGNDDYIPF